MLGYLTIDHSLCQGVCSLSDLFEPVLGKQAKEPIYSVGALMAAAFFGGAIAVFIVGIANMVRLKAQALSYVGLILGFGVTVSLSYGLPVVFELEARSNSVLIRIGGFALMGLLYLMHRREYRSMQLMGTDAPSPYLIVIVACIVANTVPILFTQYL